MKPDWKAIICAICGICIGCLFMGIYADKLHREKQTVEIQRDILSDAIRSYEDQDDKEDITMFMTAEYFLEEIGCDTTTLGEWSYCY